MNSEGWFVIDTNVPISALLSRKSPPGQCVSRVVSHGTLLFSDETLEELIGVAARPKFDRFVSRELRGEFVSALREKAELIVPTHTVIVCRDPKDDAFLSLAVSAEADAIITGDPDLLTLHPFEDIPILTPRQFLERVAAH